ncbi:MAG TPA: glycosyltransferase [Solirubrobacteraceae bacterium]|nr:glycosyltransferase [Solirubrobacteraceae bacterium]
MRASPARKPHVLTLTDTVGQGGAERVAVELAIGADPRRFRRSLCVTRTLAAHAGAERALERLRDAGVQVISLERSSRAQVGVWRRLARFMVEQRVDLIHSHKFGANVAAAVLGSALRTPVVIAHEHTWSFEGQPLRRLMDRHVVARGADAVIAVSEADRRRMIELVGMPADRVVLIHNGIDLPEVAPGGDVRRQLGIDARSPVIAQVAVLRPQKAIEVMLEAMVDVVAEHPDARLLVAGPGEPAALEATAARLGVAASVHFLGPRDDVPRILKAASVGVLSSDYEGSPLAVLEYMAAGLPTVSTDVGGVGRMVGHGVCGLLVPRRDARALARAINRLLSDPQLAASMGRRARERQRAEFSLQAMVSRVGELYERLLADARMRR